MNYGKNNIVKKREQLTSSTSMIGKKAGVSVLRMFFICMVFLAVMGTCLGFGAYNGILDNSPDISDVNIIPVGQASFIYDAEGNQIQKLSSAKSGSNRTPISIDQIPLNMQHAIVAIEDERFYEHNGIDIRGILRAGVTAVRTKFKSTQGASTITQQLLKNNVFTDWVSENEMQRIKRKIQEQYLAVKLEKSLKEEGRDAKSVILENYLNTINLGSGTYGVQEASKKYFDKDAKDLTLSECAVLAAITQNPTRWNPLNHPENNAVRRKDVLEKMLKQGYITQTEYNEALADPVYDRILATKESNPDVVPYSYFVDELLGQLKNDMVEKLGYTEIQANNAIYSSGLRIYTTQDSAIQQIMDEEYQNPENFPENSKIGIDWAISITKSDNTTVNYSMEQMRKYFRENGKPDFELLFNSQEEAQSYIDQYKQAILKEGDSILAERLSIAAQPQSSMVIIDQHTGYVKALVGGRDKKTASLTLNRATDITRQPGSCFKIVSTYGPALDLGEITLATVLNDEPTEYSNGKSVKNAGGGYLGPMTVREAIGRSRNTTAVQIIKEISKYTAFDYVEKLGFTTLEKDENKDLVEAIALGGLNRGVTNLELTSAYAAIANGGTYIKPILYTKVLDADGNVILDNTQETRQVFKESTAYLLTSAMSSVVNESYGTGKALKIPGVTMVGKTGTTNDDRDKWFVGYTPYYTCGVWSGYDGNQILPAGISRTYHYSLWKKVMSRVHENLPDIGFSAPETVKKVSICKDSGLLAGLGCKVKVEYFEVSSVPTKRCTEHYVTPTPTPTDIPEDPNNNPNGTPAPTGVPKPTKKPNNGND